MRRLSFCLLLLTLAPAAAAQPTPCDAAPTEYDGVCYYGALPAFFDDFEYTSARTTGDVEDAAEGDLFAANEWTLRDRTETTRAWYRFNRSDLPIPGTITFDSFSTMVMRLPQGLASEDHFRTPAIHTDFAAVTGTFAARVRLSELWPGQRLRQAFWTYSNSSFIFDRPTQTDTVRSRYWSELDFENQNHFQGSRRNGIFFPDYVTRMSVGNHFGTLQAPSGARRLSARGPVPGTSGRGKLARNGPAHETSDASPFIQSWADEWLYLIVEADEATRSASYRMLPERRQDGLRALEEESYTVGPEFFPLWATHPAFSIRWTEREGRLLNPLYMEVDWFYYSPATGLDLAAIRGQVEALRQRGFPRVNSTDHPTYRGFSPSQPILPVVRGPQRVDCGREASWTIDTQRLGRYYVTSRYRTLRSDGSIAPWQPMLEPSLTIEPQPGQAGVSIVATVQDLWTPHGISESARGWDYPHPDNDQEEIVFSAHFDCEAR